VPERRLECLPPRFGHIGSHGLQRPSRHSLSVRYQALSFFNFCPSW
jgi:hypothetical protein